VRSRPRPRTGPSVSSDGVMPRSTKLPGHPQREVERRDDSKVGPVDLAAGEAVAQRVAKGVRRDDDPLRTCGPLTTHVAELPDEGIRHSVIRADVPRPCAA
jgi:hypothetical protein